MMSLTGTIWSRTRAGAVEAPEILEDYSDENEIVDPDEENSSGMAGELFPRGLKQQLDGLDPSVHHIPHPQWPRPRKLRKARPRLALCEAIAVLATAAIVGKSYTLRIGITPHSLQDSRSSSRKASVGEP